MSLQNKINKKSPNFFDSSNLIETLDYDYLETFKNTFISSCKMSAAIGKENQFSKSIFYGKFRKLQSWNIKLAQKMRLSANRSDERLQNTSNSFEIYINKAKIAFLSSNYDTAEKLLDTLLDFCKSRELADNLTTFRIHQFLAQIALRRTIPDYPKAIYEYELCLKIGNDIDYYNTYMVRQDLGYIYILNQDLRKAKEINEILRSETRILDPAVRKTYYADSLRNLGLQHYANGEHAQAFDLLNKAIQEYNVAIGDSNLITFGLARTTKHLSNWYSFNNSDNSRTNIKIAIDEMNLAIQGYKLTVGLDHPEAVDCIKQLKGLKSQQ